VSFLRIGDTIVNLMALSKAERSPAGGIKLWLVGVADPVVIVGANATEVWAALLTAATPLEKFGRLA
jgi:hypothetical protein